jgi:hypothetical protein
MAHPNTRPSDGHVQRGYFSIGRASGSGMHFRWCQEIMTARSRRVVPWTVEIPIFSKSSTSCVPPPIVRTAVLPAGTTPLLSVPKVGLPRSERGASSSTISFTNSSDIEVPIITPLLVARCRSNDISQTCPSAAYLGVIRIPGRTSYEVTTGYLALKSATDCERDDRARPRPSKKINVNLFIVTPQEINGRISSVRASQRTPDA